MLRSWVILTPRRLSENIYYVISTKGRNLKLKYFQYNKISRYARNDNYGEFSESLLVTNNVTDQ
jgi:hypothetical protein